MPGIERLMPADFWLEQICKVDELMLSSLGPETDGLAGLAARHLSTGGKRLRARTALAAADALKVSNDLALPWAAACEILHNATLIHDDLQDGDEYRRGQKTIWAEYGVNAAINAGDLMLMTPFSLIDRIPTTESCRWRLARAVAQTSLKLARGQAEEETLRHHLRSNQLHERYRNVVLAKTAALFSLPVEGAALLAGRSADEAARLSAPFAHMGVAFQMIDDVLDVLGQKGRHRASEDLREGKVSALIVELLRVCPNAVDSVERMVNTPRSQVSEADVDQLLSLFNENNVVPTVLKSVREIHPQASFELAQVEIPLREIILKQVDAFT